MARIPVSGVPTMAGLRDRSRRDQDFDARLGQNFDARLGQNFDARLGQNFDARLGRDAAYALGRMPELARIEDDALAHARSRAPAGGDGFADGVVRFLTGAAERLIERAPSAEAGAMTEALIAPPLARAGERAGRLEETLREDHFRSVLDENVAAARARVALDPDGAEDSFGDLLGGLTLAADGWLGRAAGEHLAHRLEGELFDDAAQRLIERDPADAAARLKDGLWGERLGGEGRARLVALAETRAAAREEDADLDARRAARAAEIDALMGRSRRAAELLDAAARGAARREDIAVAAARGRLAAGDRDEVMAALARAEDDAAARDLAIARVEDYLSAGIMPGDQPEFWPDGRPRLPRPNRPAPHEIDRWWEHVFAPALADLPEPARVLAEDRVFGRLGHVPEAPLKRLRAALYGEEPEPVLAAALRLKGLLDRLPAGGLGLRPGERAAVAALAEAEAAMPDAATAVDHAARRLGAAGATGWREALIGVADGDGADGENDAAVAAGSAARETQVEPDTRVAQADGDTANPPRPRAERLLDAADRDDMDDDADALFKRYRENLRPREGGYVDDPMDRGGPTNKGISQETLDELRKNPKWSHLPENSSDLTDKQIDQILRVEYFDARKLDRLAGNGELQQQAPKLTEQVFDSGVLHGAPRSGKMLQQALDEITGSNLKEKIEDPKNPGQGRIDYDGDIGPKTRAALDKAVEEGKAVEVNNRMADLRVEEMKERIRKNPKQKKYEKGWIERAESFRMKTQ